MEISLLGDETESLVAPRRDNSTALFSRDGLAVLASVTMRAVRLKLLATRPPRAVLKPRLLTVRCAVKVPRLSEANTVAPRTTVIEAPAICSVNKKLAHEFNRCYVNFDSVRRFSLFCVVIPLFSWMRTAPLVA